MIITKGWRDPWMVINTPLPILHVELILILTFTQNSLLINLKDFVAD